jgi:hypothetical protein
MRAEDKDGGKVNYITHKWTLVKTVSLVHLSDGALETRSNTK